MSSGNTMINSIKELVGEDSYMEELERYTGIQRPERVPLTPERKLEIDKEKREEEMCRFAIEVYHDTLLTNEEALKKQTGTRLDKKERAHSIDALKHFKVGFSDIGTWAEINRRLQSQGYDRDEIKSIRKRVWIPAGNFVYPCFTPKGNLARINTKMLYRACYGPVDKKSDYEVCDFISHDLSKEAMEEHERTHHHKMVSPYSAGTKTAFFTAVSDIKRRSAFKWGALVEGENDAISLWESLIGTKYENKVLIIAVCGQVSEDLLNEAHYDYIKNLERIFEAFDHDHAGVVYRKQANIVYTDIPYFTLTFGDSDDDGDDIDAFLKREHQDVQSIERLFDEAHPIMPDSEAVLIKLLDANRSPSGKPVHLWSAENRKGKIKFRIDGLKGRHPQQNLHGQIELYKGKAETPYDIKQSVLHALRVEDHLNPLKIKLVMRIEEFYDTLPEEENGAPHRGIDELLEAYSFSKYKNVIYRQIGHILANAQAEGMKGFDDLVNKVKVALGAANFEYVRAEINAIVNGNIRPENGVDYPMIQLSSHFDTDNKVALFYFVKNVKDGDAIATVPCIISNNQNETRLDLLKRKEDTHMLLVEGRYQIPSEMKSAPLSAYDCSLQANYVERWKNGEIKSEDLEPAKLMEEIEEILKTIYYFTDRNIPKVLALWIYGTYFYNLFSAYPYIEITGRKGSGKSTIDSILTMLSLNGRMSTHTTGAAIYRMLNLVGGTIVLDEMESVSDKNKNDASDMGPILKGGYKLSPSKIWRMNMEAGEAQAFEIYGPKVISSINGLDHVLRDRSILVTTKPAPSRKRDGLIDVSLYAKGSRLQEIRSLTSRCAISAMTHFMRVEERFREIQFESEANRLGELMLPLSTMADLAGGSFQASLEDYYETELKPYKRYTAENTLEGQMLLILRGVSRELAGLTSAGNKSYTERITDVEGATMYPHDITFFEAQGTFVITTIHFKLLLDGMGDGQVSIKDIHTQARMLLGNQAEAEQLSDRTTFTIKNETLSKMFGNKTRIAIKKFTFSIKDYLDPDDIKNYEAKQLTLVVDEPPPF